MKARIILIFLIALMLLPAGAWSAPKRILDSIKVGGDAKTAEIKFGVRNNDSLSLGEFKNKKYVIDTIMPNTSLKRGKAINIKVKGSALINSVSAKPYGKSKVKLRIHFKEMTRNVLKGMKIERGADGVTLRINKALVLAEAKAAKLAPSEEVVEERVAEPELPALAEVKGAEDGAAAEDALAAASKGKADPEGKTLDSEQFKQKKEKLLKNLFGHKMEEKKEAAAGIVEKKDDEEKLAAKVEDVKIGNKLPDMTSLYWMAGMLIIIGAIWLLVKRLRGNPFSGFEQPIKVVASQNIGGRQRLMLIETEGRRFLIASNGTETRLLAQLDEGQDLGNADLSGLVPDGNVSLFPQAVESKIVPQETASAPAPKKQAPRRTSSGQRPSFFGGGQNSAAGQGDQYPDASKASTPKETVPGLEKRLKELRKHLR